VCNAMLLADGLLHSTCRRRRCHPWGSPQRAEGLPAPRMTVTMTAMKPASIQKSPRLKPVPAMKNAKPLHIKNEIPCRCWCRFRGLSNLSGDRMML
jgi:hypothetical protein